MTLAKTKTTRRSATAHRKRKGAHHRKNHDYKNAYWPYLPIVAIITAGLMLNVWMGNMHRSVLGYATEMSPYGLLAGTNQQRAASGLGALAINATLNQAAQAKANDMMTNNYWAHTSPSGVTPWFWLGNAGYSYQTAGENLAYGFTTSGATITGWMNSAGHRANIMNGAFQEVGFGIVNAPDYQGSGPQTIVVALYAQPAISVVPVAPTPAPAPKPAPAAAARTAQPTPKPAASSPTQAANPTPDSPSPPAQEATPAATEALEEPETASANHGIPAVASSEGGVRSEESTEISRVQTLPAVNASWSGFALSMIASIALLAFLLRHSLAWHRTLVKGENFILKHPLVDIAFVGIATLGFILTQTSGLIK